MSQTQPDTIPLSPALAEASPDSLSDLFARDPEGLSRTDLDRLIATLREQRTRWLAADGTGRAPKAAKVKALTSPVNATDLGV